MQERARRLAQIIITPFARLGITANIFTLSGFFLNVVTCLIIAFGHLTMGGLMVLFAGIFDMFDGAAARSRDEASIFGAFLDSTLDRYAEGIVLTGLAVYTMNNIHTYQQLTLILIYCSIIGSFMVSYTRARAEGLQIECKVGLIARPERVILLALGLITHLVLPMLIVLTILSNFTAIQRIVYVWFKTRGLKPTSDGKNYGENSKISMNRGTASVEN